MLLILKLKRRENKDITAKIGAPRRERHSGRGLPPNLHEIFDEVIHIGRTGARTINLKCKINIFEERIFGSGWGLPPNLHGILYQLMNIGRAGQIRVYGTRDHTTDRQRCTAKMEGVSSVQILQHSARNSLGVLLGILLGTTKRRLEYGKERPTDI